MRDHISRQSLNPAQKIALATYPDGEMLFELGSGDTLFTFIMVELADKEDCDTLLEAIIRIDTAMKDLAQVWAALNAAYAHYETPSHEAPL